MNTVSKQAQNFIDVNLPVDLHRKVTTENIRDIRIEAMEGYSQAITSSRQQYSGEIDQQTTSGIDCLKLCPGKSRNTKSEKIILYFYGGAFVQGSPEEDLPITTRLSDLSGFDLISPRYRLSPEARFPAPLEDGLAVYKNLINQYQPQNIALAGESAGGNLALQVLNVARSTGLAMPGVVALLSPWSDILNRGDSLGFNNGRDPTLVVEYLDTAASLHATVEELAANAPSPLFNSFYPDYPPTLITSGTRDLLLSQCVILAARMRDAGINVALRVWEEMWHVFEFYPLLPEAEASLQEIAGFLKSHLGKR